MRSLQIYSGNLFGGVENFLAALARHRQVALDWHPHFALCYGGRLLSLLQQTGVPVHGLGKIRVSRPWSVVRGRGRLARLLRDDAFDVAVCHSAWSMAIFGPVVRSAGVPLVFWLHDVTDGKHWLERWARWTLPDLAVCNSQFTAAFLPSMYPHVQARVIHPLVPRPPTFSEEERRSARADLHAPADAVVIIQASRLQAWKGQALLLEALGRIRDCPGWVCWQIGGAQKRAERKYESELKKKAADLGIADRVQFLGQRHDVPRLLAAADIYCQPNLAPEPFGIAFMEALYAELPVVTTAMGAPLDTVQEDCGVFVKGQPAALAQALRRLIFDPCERRRLGSNGPRRAQTLCDPEKQLRLTMEVFRSAVGYHQAQQAACSRTPLPQ